MNRDYWSVKEAKEVMVIKQIRIIDTFRKEKKDRINICF